MTTTPFLGCKISLISKSEIRYEGILYTIDPKESTIALAKVRSYGTEDRPAERQVPPREEIFEYIIFRAGDIKDLIVDDPPASIAPGLADPAIIQAHSTSTSSGATFPSSTFPQMTTNSSITSANSGQRSTGPAFQSASSAISSLASSLGGTNVTYNTANSVESRSGNSTPTGQQQRIKNPLNDGTTQTSVIKATPNRDNKYVERRGGAGEKTGSYNYSRRGGQQNYQSNYQSHPQQNRRGSGQQNYRQQNQSYSQPSQSAGNRYRDNYNSNRQYSNYSSGVRRAPMQSRPPPQRASQNRAPVRPRDTIKFDGEFDFDKAEKEFKELEEKMTNLKMDSISANKPEESTGKESSDTTNEATNGDKQQDKEGVENEPDAYYDKGKSFFDHISCEALEREKGNVQRIDWKAERKLNSETFGVPMSYRRIGFRGRGFSNARGYSGGYRNPRGGYGSGMRQGGGGDTRRFNGPQRNKN